MISWIVLGSIASASLSIGDPGSVVINVRAYVDGRSQLILDDGTAQWHHFEHAAPGRLACHEGEPIQPTIINGIEWFPEWPDVPNCENRRCFCLSDVFGGVTPGVPDEPMNLALEVIDCRWECTIVEYPSVANGFRAVVEFDDNPPLGAAWYEVNLVLTECVEPENYCTSTPNSTGLAATLGLSGSLSIADNEAVLLVSNCPPLTLGLFGYSTAPTELPFGDGYLCLNPFPVIHRLEPPLMMGDHGTVDRWIDFTSLPPAAQMVAGTPWYIQLWFRDAQNGSYGFNLSDGLRVVFCP